jgi:D-3-phosphoglycerate dehydrogenase
VSNIAVVQPIHPRGMAILSQAGEVIIPENTSDEIVSKAGRDAQALVVRLTHVSAGLMDAMPSLKVIGRNGVGVDNIDVEAASARKIMVINTPGTNSNSVAEYVIAAFLFLLKRLGSLDSHTRKGDWAFRDHCRGLDVEGKTLGIVGMGQIGSILLKKCQIGLGMRTLVYDPLLSPEKVRRSGAEQCPTLDVLLSQSDVVSIHVPLTEGTQGLFNAERLSLMKKGAVLVNASRGGIVDEVALGQVLRDGTLSGAALDVFCEEPPAKKSPLWDVPNLLVTPHIAGMTEDAAIRTAEAMAMDVIVALRGGNPVHLFNREAFEGV